MPYDTIRYYLLLYYTIQWHTILYHAMPCHTMLCYTILRKTAMVELFALQRLDLQLVEDAQALVRQLEVIVSRLSFWYSQV